MGLRDDRPTWLIAGDWRIFARPAGELIPGGTEVAAFPAAQRRHCQRRLRSSSRVVSLPFSPAEAYLNYLTEARTRHSSRRGLSPRQLDAFYRVKPLCPRPFQIGPRAER